MSRADDLLRGPHPGLERTLEAAERVEVPSPEDDEGFFQVEDDETTGPPEPGSPGAFIRKRLSPATLKAIDRLETDDEEIPTTAGPIRWRE